MAKLVKPQVSAAKPRPHQFTFGGFVSMLATGLLPLAICFLLAQHFVQKALIANRQGHTVLVSCAVVLAVCLVAGFFACLEWKTPDIWRGEPESRIAWNFVFLLCLVPAAFCLLATLFVIVFV